MSRRSSIGIVVLLLIAACTSSSATNDLPNSSSATPASLLVTDGYSLLCGGAVCDVPSGGVPRPLWRPLHLPTLGAGEVCPVSTTQRVSRSFGPAVGSGAVFAVGLGTKAIFPFEFPPSRKSIFYGSGWGGNKVLWIARPSYTGPVLIRGEQLDGPHAVGFSMGSAAAYTNLQLPPGKKHGFPGGSPDGYHGWRNWPSETRLQGSGCYAYQVDGTTFSEVIIFRAVASSP